MSLNFAVFRSALARGERIGAGPGTRAWRRVLLFASRWAQIESLYRFNAKFQPALGAAFHPVPWDVVDLPRVGRVAYLEAEAFLVWPTLKPRRIAAKLGLGRLRRRLRWRPRDEGRRPRPAASSQTVDWPR